MSSRSGRKSRSTSSPAPPSSRKSRQQQQQQENDVDMDEEEYEEKTTSSYTASSSSSSALFSTPASRRSSSAAVAPASPSSLEDTPTRLSRLDEKSSLQGLNKRLEVYILKQRERDASNDGWLREIEILRSKHINELEIQKNLFENQMQLLRKNRDELSLKTSGLEADLITKSNENKEMKSKIENENKSRKELENRLVAIQKELVSAQNNNASLQNQLKNLSEEYENLKGNQNEMNKMMDALRKTSENAVSKSTKLQQQYNDLSEEYQLLQNKYANETKKMVNKIHELYTENHRSQEEIRKECETRFTSLFHDKQLAYDQDRENALNEMKKQYDEKLYGYRHKLEEAGHLLEASRSENKTLHLQLEKEIEKNNNLNAELSICTHRITSLEKELAAEKQNPSLLQQLHEKNEALSKMKMIFKRKDQEFDELMDVKIMLDLEIKSYRTMLEQEEKRMGLGKYKQAVANTTTTTTNIHVEEEASTESMEESESSSSASSSSASARKRRRTSSSSSSSSSSAAGRSGIGGSSGNGRRVTRSASASRQIEEETEEGNKIETKQDENMTSNNNNADDKKSALLFSRNDNEYSYIGMTNRGRTSANLKGWTLYLPLHNIEFQFPDVLLQSQTTYYVMQPYGKHPPTASPLDQIGHWKQYIQWQKGEEKKDYVELKAPNGATVASVAIDTNNSSKHNQQQQNQCVIM